MNKKEKLKAITKYFTLKTQLIKLNEEIGELIIAVFSNNYDEIVEELADTNVLLHQIRENFDISQEEIEEVENKKIDRTLKRIDDGYYQSHR